MNIIKLIAPFSILLVVMLCTNSCINNQRQDKRPPKSLINTASIIIDLQPFSDISAAEINYVANQLKTVYHNIRILEPLQMPATAFYPKRNRYRADSLIGYLAGRTQTGYVTIGLTNKDISTTKGSNQDWGVMGLGFCPGSACIASGFRLSKKEKMMQLFKVSIHELGHTQGLPHCAVKYCFMRDAEGQNPTNEETDFCTSCKLFLEGKGWNFK